MKFFGVLVLAFVLVSSSGAKKDFTGDQVLSLYPKSDLEADFIKGLGKEYELVDFWKPKYSGEVRANNEVDIRFARSHLANFKSILEFMNIEYRVKIDNVQALMDNQVKGRKNAAKDFLVHNYNVFHPYEEIQKWAEDIAAAYPSLVTLEVMGQSYENRDLQLLTISTNLDNPAIIIDCAFHAREWISPAFCQCFTRNLLEGYGKDPVITGHMDKLTYYIIPLVNIDGYAYSWDTDRLWRKTRSNYGTPCDGVDPNRNTDANFGGEGSSGISCDNTYRGPFAESEPEVKLVADFVRAHKDHTMAYLTMHSYSQLFVLPWSYTVDPPPTIKELNKYAEQAAKLMTSVNGVEYTYGQGSSSLYLVSGGSKDFAYDQGIPFTCTLELRDTGEYGFLLPEDQIEPTCVEVTAGMRVISDGALEMWYNKQMASKN